MLGSRSVVGRLASEIAEKGRLMDHFALHLRRNMVLENCEWTLE